MIDAVGPHTNLIAGRVLLADLQAKDAPMS